MGFLAAAFGLSFGHGDAIKILNFIADKVWIDDELCNDYESIDLNDDERTIKIKLIDDIVAKEYDSKKKKKIFVNELELDIADFNCHCYKLYYAKNPKIKIGAAHCCAWMIYLGRVDEDTDPVEIDFKLLAELKQWKKELISQNRIPPNIKLKLVGNCCS